MPLEDMQFIYGIFPAPIITAIWQDSVKIVMLFLSTPLRKIGRDRCLREAFYGALAVKFPVTILPAGQPLIIKVNHPKEVEKCQ
jgi:hypothetical protein